MGNILNELGINTVYAYPIKIKPNEMDLERSPRIKQRFDNLETYMATIQRMSTSVMTEDVRSLGLDIYSAKEILEDIASYVYRNVGRDGYFGRFSLEMLTLSECRRYCSYIMTDECYNQFVNMFIGAVLSTNSDLHFDNFFFYKTSPENEFYDGVISIDNEIVSAIDDFNPSASCSMKQFRRECAASYGSQSPFGNIDFMSYRERLDRINKLAGRGRLGESQMSTIRNFANVDIEFHLQELEREYGLVYDIGNSDRLKCLWDYARNNLEMY